MNIKKIVFFDLETACEYSSLKELEKNNNSLFQLWQKRADYLRSRFEENKNLSDDELYLQKAALSPEFARIVCATFGRLEIKSDEVLGETSKLTLKSYKSQNEMEILKGAHDVFDKFKGFKFCGHNVKRFDVPMLCKRLIINGFSLPNELQVQNMKSWEVPFIDTAEQWSFGAWQESFTSLDLLCTVLGVDSPKDKIEGSEVNTYFWQGRVDEIAEYCEKDVVATAQCYLKLNGQSRVEEISKS